MAYLNLFKFLVEPVMWLTLFRRVRALCSLENRSHDNYSLSLSIGAMAVKALCVLQDMKQSLNVFEKYQGTYLLLVHPDEKVFLLNPDTFASDFSHFQFCNVLLFIPGATLGDRRSEDYEECGPGRLL